MSSSNNVSLGISWYSVLSAWRNGDMPIAKFIKFAHEAGADGIELLDAFLYAPGVIRDHLPSDETIQEFSKEALMALSQYGMNVHAVCVTNDFNHEDATRLKVERAKIELGIKLAKAFSAPVVRVFSGNPTSSDSVELVRYSTIDALKDLSDQSVTLALENHGAVFASPSRLESILEPLNKSNVGLCFDIGNFLLADVDPVEAARYLPVPSLVHVKDFRLVESGAFRSNAGLHYNGCRLGEGVVQIRETLEVLLHRLDGHPISIDLEMECGDGGIEATRHGITWLKELVRAS